MNVNKMKYKKKPVIVEAVQWFNDGDDSDVKYYDLSNLPLNPEGLTFCEICDKGMYTHGWIKTLEGGHIVCPGDYIITGVKGEKYPCKPDIFKLTYEELI
jgi:hypothetical protein